MSIKSILTTVAILAISGTAAAHPKLLAASPTANAMVATPTHVDLHFSEKLVPAFSKGDVTMAAMPGMAAMKMLSTASVAKDGKTLVIKPQARLASGRYIVDWHVVSTDTHKVAGSYVFTVK
jgi:methionine-rich copper-binding protein CopC